MTDVSYRERNGLVALALYEGKEIKLEDKYLNLVDLLLVGITLDVGSADGKK